MSTTSYLKCLILVSGMTLFGCVTGSPPEAELSLARAALLAAENAGAAELAQKSYREAQSSLSLAESLISDHAFAQARPLLEQATILAQSAYNEAATKPDRSQTGANATQPAPPHNGNAILPQPLASTYTVQSGDNLWSIAARSDVYGDPLLWPLLYQGNRDQIKDPRQVYTGQTLTIQRNLSETDREETRGKARSSDIFPIEQMSRNSP